MDSVFEKLSVVIVTFNSAHVVREAIAKLPSEVQVVVVDNDSQDDSIATVAGIRSDAVIIRNASNVGFARAVNAGVSLVERKYVLLLNPDAVISSESILHMLGYLESHEEVSVAAPDIIEGGGIFDTVAAGYEPVIWRMFAHASGLSRFAGPLSVLRGHYLLRAQLNGRSEVDVDWVSGGCMFVRRTEWIRVGGLSERWFMYAEDVEFCLRIRDEGGAVRMVTKPVAVHAVGQSSQESVSGTVPNTLWIGNLFDLYRFRYRAGFCRSFLWRLVVGLGYLGRAGYVVIASWGDRGSREHDRRRFVAYARAAFIAG